MSSSHAGFIGRRPQEPQRHPGGFAVLRLDDFERQVRRGRGIARRVDGPSPENIVSLADALELERPLEARQVSSADQDFSGRYGIGNARLFIARVLGGERGCAGGQVHWCSIQCHEFGFDPRDPDVVFDRHAHAERPIQANRQPLTCHRRSRRKQFGHWRLGVRPHGEVHLGLLRLSRCIPGLHADRRRRALADDGSPDREELLAAKRQLRPCFGEVALTLTSGEPHHPYDAVVITYRGDDADVLPLLVRRSGRGRGQGHHGRQVLHHSNIDFPLRRMPRGVGGDGAQPQLLSGQVLTDRHRPAEHVIEAIRVPLGNNSQAVRREQLHMRNLHVVGRGDLHCQRPPREDGGSGLRRAERHHRLAAVRHHDQGPFGRRHFELVRCLGHQRDGARRPHDVEGVTVWRDRVLAL